VLVERGYVRAVASDGTEWTFAPSLARIASLGHPREIVEIYAALHGPRDAETAAYVLTCLCERADPAPLIGWAEDEPGAAPPRTRWMPGMMPAAEQVIIARHLMQHGICGLARPGGASAEGSYSDSFDAAEYVDAARVHLGLSGAEAEALSMSEFQAMLEMRFPDKAPKRDMPTREEYEETMRVFNERRAGRG
jgi:hypothetical protein